MMGAEEYQQLKTDIAANGLREAIWLHPVDGSIIDGRNRYNACLDVGVEPKYRTWDGKGSLVQFVVSLNLYRRHLTSLQCAGVALDILPLLEAEAKERQIAGALATNTGSQKIDYPEEEKGKATEQAAAMVNTNRQYVSDMKRYRDQEPALFEAAKTGRVNGNQAKTIEKLPTEIKELALARLEQGSQYDVDKVIADAKRQHIDLKKEESLAIEKQCVTNAPIVYHKSAVDLLNDYPDNHFDLLVTDPPYMTDVDDIDLFVDEWLPLALTKVKSTGRVYICTGAYPKEMGAFIAIVTGKQ